MAVSLHRPSCSLADAQPTVTSVGAVESNYGRRVEYRRFGRKARNALAHGVLPVVVYY